MLNPCVWWSLHTPICSPSHFRFPFSSEEVTRQLAYSEEVCNFIPKTKVYLDVLNTYSNLFFFFFVFSLLNFALLLLNLDWVIFWQIYIYCKYLIGKHVHESRIYIYIFIFYIIICVCDISYFRIVYFSQLVRFFVACINWLWFFFLTLNLYNTINT